MDIKKITKEHVHELIEEAVFTIPTNTLMTICVLRLRNGFTVTGESACINDEMFCEKKGEDLAFTNAANKVYILEAYLAKQRMYNEAQRI